MNKLKFRKILEKLPVKEQLAKLRQELKNKKNKEMFEFLQSMVKNIEIKEKPKQEVNNQASSGLIENLSVKEVSSELESKIAAEKPAFQIEEKIYGVKEQAYDAKDTYKSQKNEDLKFKEDNSPSFGFFKKMKEYEDNTTKPTEKYKRKEKLV